MPTPVKELFDGQFAMKIGGLRVNSSSLTFAKSGSDIVLTLTLTITPDQIGKGPIRKDVDPCGVFNISPVKVLGITMPQLSIENDTATNYITMGLSAAQTGVKGEHGDTTKEKIEKKPVK